MNESTPPIEAEITRDDFQRAILDATRALVLQNARLTRRRDPFRRWRTERFEATTQKVGTIAALVGTVLAAIVVPIQWTDTGELPVLAASLLLVMVVLLVVFRNIDRIQARALRFTNDLLATRADKMLATIGKRVPATVGYAVEDGEIRGDWSDGGELISSWSHTLNESCYGLVGEASIILFDDKDARAPVCFCFFSTNEQRARLREVLEANDVTLEVLDPSLLPESTVERPWPEAV